VGLTPSPPSSAEVLKRSRAIPLLNLRAFVAYKTGDTFFKHELNLFHVRALKNILQLHGKQ